MPIFDIFSRRVDHAIEVRMPQQSLGGRLVVVMSEDTSDTGRPDTSVISQ